MKKENQGNYNHGVNILSVVAGMLIGGLVGAVTMLLLAPQSGEETRVQLQEKSYELLDQANGMLEDAITQVRMDRKEIVMGGQEKAKELLQQGKDLVVEQLEKVSDAANAGKKAIQSS
jgi:gas vesicle protein